MDQTTRKRLLGFSLVELMAVVTVIGILVALALPRFRAFIATSRQAEAIHNLGVILTLQKAFHLRAQGLGQGDNAYHSGLSMGAGTHLGKCDNSLAGQNNSLGFRVEDCSRLRYTYRTRGSSATDRATNMRGSWNIYPGCTGAGSRDEWQMSKEGVLTHQENILDHCAN